MNTEVLGNGRRIFWNERRNGRATDPLVALQLLSRVPMRRAFYMVVIIAGVVVFTRDDIPTVSPTSARVQSEEIVDARDTRRDFNGNVIAPAVADYFVDPYGEMYERHAPDTALLELGQPES